MKKITETESNPDDDWKHHELKMVKDSKKKKRYEFDAEDETIGIVVARNTARLIFNNLEHVCMFECGDNICIDKIFYEELKKEFEE